MNYLVASVVAAGTVVLGCTIQPEGAENPSRGQSAGVITSSELLELFVDTCLTHFPDGKATTSAFNRAGLRSIPLKKIEQEAYGDELGRFENVERKATGGFGPVIHEVAAGYDGPLLQAQCSVQAEIADPDRVWKPLVASLPERFPSLKWTSVGALRASFARDGAVFEMNVEPHAPGYTWEGATPRCVEEDCGEWEEAVLTLGITK